MLSGRHNNDFERSKDKPQRVTIATLRIILIVLALAFGILLAATQIDVFNPFARCR